MAQFETERLILRPLALTDVPAIQEQFPQWDIAKFMTKSVPWPYPADGAYKYMMFAQAAMLQGTEIFWAIVHKDNDEKLIGCISLRDQDSGSGNIGFWLAIDQQGKGLMSEATTAIYDYAFNTLGFDKLTIINAADNMGSSKLQLKSGATLTKTHDNPNYLGGYVLEEVWDLTADGFRSKQKQA